MPAAAKNDSQTGWHAGGPLQWRQRRWLCLSVEGKGCDKCKPHHQAACDMDDAECPGFDGGYVQCVEVQQCVAHTGEENDLANCATQIPLVMTKRNIGYAFCADFVCCGIGGLPEFCLSCYMDLH